MLGSAPRVSDAEGLGRAYSFAYKLTGAADAARSQTAFENHWPSYSSLIGQEAESQREKVTHPWPTVGTIKN